MQAGETLLLTAPTSLAAAERAGSRRLGLRGPGLPLMAARPSPERAEVRVAVIGVGALGQHHARVYAALPGRRLAGVYDIDRSRAAEVAARHGVRAFEHLRDLLDEVDAVSVAVPTVDHHRVAARPARCGQDVLVEKPMATTVAEADDLIRARRRARRASSRSATSSDSTPRSTS